MARGKVKKAKQPTYTRTGTYVGGYLLPEQFEKLLRVEAALKKLFGEEGVNRTMALRFIVENFDEDKLPRVGKPEGN